MPPPCPQVALYDARKSERGGLVDRLVTVTSYEPIYALAHTGKVAIAPQQGNRARAPLLEGSVKRNMS